MMREIHQGLLWTGNARDIREPRVLFETEISAVVDLALEEQPAQLPRQFVYCRIPIIDGSGNDLSLLRMALRTTVQLLESGARTIVACSAGLSRSPTIATCALAMYLGRSPEGVLVDIDRKFSLDLHGELWQEVCALADEM